MVANAVRGAGNLTRRRPRAALALAVFLAALIGLGVGVLGERRGLTDRVRGTLRTAMDALRDPNVQEATWRQAPLNQHTLEWTQIRVGDPTGGGGGLTEIDGHLVFATPHGLLNAMSPNYRLYTLGLRTPMNLEGARASPLAADPLFSLEDLRTHGLFARETAPGRWTLYATLTRFGGENCFQFVIASTDIAVEGPVLRAVDGQWRDVYIARPGCIRMKDRSSRFRGQQAGGRMQMLDAATMLVSVGDHQFDGFNDSHRAPMDPDWDLGKIIALNLQTGDASVFAEGLRNPQGLVVMRDGRIFETEHGPQGGDEINFVRRGGNYGWPLVTYGMNYGYPRRLWESDPEPGGHAGYTRPAFAFVPSIGISAIVQPSAEMFPRWGQNDLLMGSLREATLYHVRVDGERVAYAEPLRLEGERLRDMVSMADGRVAILSDSGRLILVRNADRFATSPRGITVTGYTSLAQDERAPQLSREESGRAMFAVGCASCHSLTGEANVGPPLNGVVGRDIASWPDYNYSPALIAREGRWTEDNLLQFVTDPQHFAPGTLMPPSTLSWVVTPDIIAYLRTTRGPRDER